MKKLLLILTVICVSSSYSRSGLQQFAIAISTNLDAHTKWQEKKALEEIQAEQEYFNFFKKFISKNVQTAKSAAHATVQAVGNQVEKLKYLPVLVNKHIANFMKLHEQEFQENYQLQQERLRLIKEYIC